MNSIKKTSTLAAVVAAAALTVSACGSDPVEIDELNPDGGSETTEASALAEIDEAEIERIRAMVPQEYADAGEITAVNSGSFPPYTIVQEGGAVEGASAELADAVGEVWGIEVNHVTADGLSSILTGMSSGRFDFAFGPIGDFKERQGENDFVDYVQEFVVFAVPAGNPNGIEGLETTCGLKIAVQAGGSAEKVIQGQAETCASEGEEPLEVMSFKDQPQSILAVRSGRADAFFSSQAPLTYFVEQADGELELAGIGQDNGFDTLYQGAVVAKDSELGPLLQETLAVLFEAGVYEDVMTKWNLGDNMIDEPGMNLAVS